MYRQRSQINNTQRTARIRRLTPAARREAFDPRRGFTLVEMLVSVALVVIMMSMFATVFQLAAGSIGTQRGIAENDQRARSVVTVIQNDLKKRSFRVLTPFAVDEHNNPGPPVSGDPDFAVRDFAERRGFFYISENDRIDDTDDVLHFTVELDGTTNDLYFGKAVSLYPLSTNGTSFLDSNEPDRDDLNPSPDQTSDSVAAEIAIFMRGGRLYRRVLLLRDPLTNGETPPLDVQPNDNNRKYFDPNNDGTGGLPDLYTGNFWNDFDFSAHFGLTAGNVATGAEFHGKDSLNNSISSSTMFGDIANVVKVPANPRFRFGHNQLGGLPREYVGTSGGATNNQFIGRFTHEETSFGFFRYPQTTAQDGSGTAINDGNPMEQNPSSRQLNLVNDIVTDSTGVVFSGPRRAEDLLLSNVHAFDIKVWDEALQEFVDVGHDREDSMNNPIGDYNLNNRINAAYGPNGPNGNRVFDTWHWQLDLDNADGDDNDLTGRDSPPYRPLDGSNNPKPLKAIQITIRYYDVSSNQLRQVTQQISLVD